MDDRLAIGIDLGATNIRGGIVDKNGNYLVQYNELTPSREGRDAVIDKICTVIDFLKKQNSNVCGIGIGTPGIVNQETGNIIGASPNIIDWTGTSLGSILENRFDLRVVVDNDVNVVTLGEFQRRENKSSKDLACIALGTGVGIGIIIDGVIFRRAHELGHSIVNYDGGYCGCGRQGCVEASTSGMWLIKNYLSLARGQNCLSDEKLNTSDIFVKFKEGEFHAKTVINQFIQALASIVTNIILAYSITDFIIVGGVAQAFPVFGDLLLTEVHKRSISHLSNKIYIKQESNNSAGLLGAASLIFNKII